MSGKPVWGVATKNVRPYLEHLSWSGGTLAFDSAFMMTRITAWTRFAVPRLVMVLDMGL
jgi:predicted SAM-dependent methyltransferase